MSTERSALLALDAGQTGTKTRLVLPSGDSRETLLPGVRTHEPVIAQVATLAALAAGELGAPSHVLAVGLTGLSGPGHHADELAHLLRSSPVPPRKVLVAHDSVTSYLGAVGRAAGAVVAAGGGVVTLGVGPRGAVRVDGWGNVMGDAGSGHWIGQRALEAVMRAHDGRGPATALTAIVQRRWPVLEEAYLQLQASPDRVRTVASFASDVAGLAASDGVAARISREAGGELAHSVATALGRAGVSPSLGGVVAAIGGVFRSDALRSAFAAELARTRPDARVIEASGSGLDGVAALAVLPANHPLRSLVSEASVASESHVG